MQVTDEIPLWNDKDMTTLQISRVVKHYSALLTVLQILHSHKYNVTFCMIMKQPHFFRATKERKFKLLFRWIWQLHNLLIYSCYGICQHLFQLLDTFHIKKDLQPHTACVYICTYVNVYLYHEESMQQRLYTWYPYSYSVATYLFKFCSFLFFQQSAFTTQIITKTYSSNIFHNNPYLLLHLSGVIHFLLQ